MMEDAGDVWQRRLNRVVYEFGRELAELHASNPWPESGVLDVAMAQLATEFWDRCFSQTEIRAAYGKAMAELKHYGAGSDRRP
ncbi:MAG: hypothetical protein HIU91_08995 [Acidobacteria bacterium]|nr:hypothetical protein [Acidobacteriota bacterium]